MSKKDNTVQIQSAEGKLDSILNDFVKESNKSKIAVIIPMYGYWGDTKDNPLNGDLFKSVMERIYSSSNEIYTIIVAESKRLPPAIFKTIQAKASTGIYTGINVPTGASYGDYIRAGIEAAYDDTSSRFFIVVNPWVLIQQNAIDAMAERLNRRDIAIVSGFDIRPMVDTSTFEANIFQSKSELFDLNIDFFGFERFAYEILRSNFDMNTRRYFARNLWTAANNRGYYAISSQHLPVYTFDSANDIMEEAEAEIVELDKNLFISKWGFSI